MKQLFRKISLFIFPFVFSLVVRALYTTTKKNFHVATKIPTKPFILVFWHNDSIFSPFAFQKVCSLPVKSIISEHQDGEMMRKTVAYFGIGSVRGSSSRGGAKALISSIKSIQDGYCIALTPDGPKGPLYSIAGGVILLAQKLQCDIVVFTSRADRFWELPSWDRYKIPKFFSKVDFYFSDPIRIDGLSDDAAKERLKMKMMEHINV